MSRAVTVCARSANKDVVVYNDSGNRRIEVLADANTVWLNRQQLALMFGRDIKTIGKHIANALKEELKGFPVVAKFATTAADGKTYNVEYYSVDMILSVGYRVKSSEGVRFRMWANGVLKSRLMRQAADSKLLKELEKRLSNHEFRIADAEQAIKYVLDTLLPPVTKRKPIGYGVKYED